jgi:hypothetical protein
VSARKGPAGSGASQTTSSPNHLTSRNVQSKVGTRGRAAMTSAVTMAGGTNG